MEDRVIRYFLTRKENGIKTIALHFKVHEKEIHKIINKYLKNKISN